MRPIETVRKVTKWLGTGPILTVKEKGNLLLLKKAIEQALGPPDEDQKRFGS